MKHIPLGALIWGLATLAPLVYAVLGIMKIITPLPYYWAAPYPILQLSGALLIAMLGGIYWGFASKNGGSFHDAILSAVPFFIALGASLSGTPMLFLAIANGALIIIDALYSARGLAPNWWLPLRFITGSIAVACLLTGHYA